MAPTRHDQKVIDYIVQRLRKTAPRKDLRKTVINNPNEEFEHRKEIDIMLRTQNDNIMIIEVKTKDQREDPIEVFKEALDQMKVARTNIMSNLQEYVDILDVSKKNPRIIYSFVYYCRKAKGSTNDEGLYILKGAPKSRTSLKSKKDILKYTNDPIQYKDFVKQPWHSIERC